MDIQKIILCRIGGHDSGNVSDHLPLQLVTNMDLFQQTLVNKNTYSRDHMQWDNDANNVKYYNLVEEKLNSIKIPIFNQDNAEHSVTGLLDKITDVLHTSAQFSGCAVQKRHKPKAWWCPHLSQLRDKKRFWWHIWVCNGRPREGVVFDCWKGAKKLFRKYARCYSQSRVDSHLSKLNGLYHGRNHASFWSSMRKGQSLTISSSLRADQFAAHYSNVMSDDGHLTPQQEHIKHRVHSHYDRLCKSTNSPDASITTDQISEYIKLLKKGCSPGVDGVTSEHLSYANSNTLRHYLQIVLSCLIQYTVVPNNFATGIIVPVLKRPSLNPNQVENYRPITLGSTYSKLMELFLIPSDNTMTTQFGFKDKRGTDFACGLMNDVLCYAKEKGSPIYLCSLDAEKCFDRIWHDGLFYKLMDIIPSPHWSFLYKMYKQLNTKVRWNGTTSEQFKVTRGTRQGSILSPTLFNIFIDELLQKLSCINTGVYIGGRKYNSMAYADDISLFTLTTAGLQEMINCCVKYADEWRFSFGVNKSKCLIVGKQILRNDPKFYLGSNVMHNVDSLDTLGVTFNKSGTADTHIENRASSARRAFYKAMSQGVNYPGLSSELKGYLWRTWVSPVLSYGVATLPITTGQLKDMDRVQTKQIKQFMGLGNRTHHTHLLGALEIKKMSCVLVQMLRSLYHRVFLSDTPYRTLVTHQLADYISNKSLVKGTLIYKMVQNGINPIDAMKNRNVPKVKENNGLVDTIKFLINTDRYNSPDSFEYNFIKLLVSAF